MVKKYVVAGIAVVGVLAISGGAYAVTASIKQKDTIMKNDTAMTAKQMMPSNATATEANSTHGAYVAFATYEKDPAMYSNTKKVYFFHASWCPNCQAIDKSFTEGTTKIPEGVTIIKTDFDTATSLRQKYGVTTQYTFVQVDNQGNEVMQWSATDADKAIMGIK